MKSYIWKYKTNMKIYKILYYESFFYIWAHKIFILEIQNFHALEL